MNWIILITTLLVVVFFDFTSSNDSNLNEIAEIEFEKDFIKVTSPTILNNSTEGRPNLRRKIHSNEHHHNKKKKRKNGSNKNNNLNNEHNNNNSNNNNNIENSNISNNNNNNNSNNNNNNNSNNDNYSNNNNVNELNTINDKRNKLRRRKDQKKKFTRLKNNINNNDNNSSKYDGPSFDDYNKETESILTSIDIKKIRNKITATATTTITTESPLTLSLTPSNVTIKKIKKHKKMLTPEQKEKRRLARLERKQMKLLEMEREKEREEMIIEEKRMKRLEEKAERKRLREVKKAAKQKRIMERHLKKKMKEQQENATEVNSSLSSVNNVQYEDEQHEHYPSHHHNHHQQTHFQQKQEQELQEDIEEQQKQQQHEHQHQQQHHHHQQHHHQQQHQQQHVHQQKNEHSELISHMKQSSLNFDKTFDDDEEEVNYDKTIFNESNKKMTIIGDLSCMKNGFKPSQEIPNANIKYLRNDELGITNAYLEAEYICNAGYKLKYQNDDKTNLTKNLICKNEKWIGELPKCISIQETLTNITKDVCRSNRGKCDQLCFIENKKEICSCYKGFKSIGTKCIDIDECRENESICEYGCSNTVGSYRCKCPMGLRSGDSNNCIDINECLLRNGHGPCQDTCVNTWSGYKCTCDGLPGSRLSDDKHSCEDFDECSVNNGGCSHTCLNTHGRGFCVCPEGWILDEDWKTCIDIDECADQISLKPELRCEYSCVNTLGSYKCVTDIGADQPIIDDLPLCSTGYIYNSTTEDCQDLNECNTNNGGCYDRCINTMGSFHCSCKTGFIFGPDKYTCIVTNITTTVISCPPLFPPRHGYLECTRPIGRLITNRPGSQCILRCPNGFRVVGKFAKYCGNDGKWNGDSDGACIRYPTPKLTCPQDMTIEVPKGEQQVQLLQLPRPKTDVHFERDVTVEPAWGKNFKSSISLHVGYTNITYTAKHPISKLSVSCTFTIHVLDGKPPVVLFCPDTQKYTLSKQHDNIKISWIEPDFVDNVNVTDISRTNIPGNYFGIGSHQIVYEAKDAAGYTAKCLFKILVSAPKRRGLKLQLPLYNSLYKK